MNWYFPITVLEAILMSRVNGRLVPWPSKADLREAERVADALPARRATRRERNKYESKTKD